MLQTAMLGLVVSIIASFLVLLGDRSSRSYRLWRALRWLPGEYEWMWKEPEKHKRVETITITRRAGNKFEVTCADEDEKTWDELMTVRENMPPYGFGVFRSLKHDGWGVHEYLFDKAKKEIAVYGRNQGNFGSREPFRLRLRKQGPSRTTD